MKKGLLKNLLDEIIDEFPSEITEKSQVPPEFRHNKFRKKTKKKETPKNLWETREEKQVYKPPVKEEKYQVDKKSGSRIKMSRSEMRKAIIYSEILGKPKSLR